MPDRPTSSACAAAPPHIPVRRTTPRRIWITLIVLATLAYYFWTGMIGPGGAPRIHGEETDHFNLLSRGFRKGHLHLDGEVPEALIRAANPYDPASRGDIPVLHDASYYQGKYYIYFGPAPVVTLLLPFNLVTGRDLPLAYGVWFFSSVGYLAVVGIFLFLQRRYYPGASTATVTASLLALGGATIVVALLRRANIWEFSAASGFCYVSLSLLCLVRAVHSPRAITWGSLGGVMLGLAVASRPTYILCSAVFALPLLFNRWTAAGKNQYGWRALLGAAVGCGIPVLLLLAYNYARFGNPLEFGLTYQLTSVIESQSRHFSLEYIGFNFHVYFLSRLHWLPTFPFVTGIALPPLPPGHGGHEFSFGLFANLPFAWFSVVVLAMVATWRVRRDPRHELGISVGVIGVAGVLNAALLLCFFGSCIRYMVDFTPSCMLLAAIGVLQAEDWLRAPRARTTLRVAALTAAIGSAAVTAASVISFYDNDRSPPAPYHPIARVLNRPYFWLQGKRWPDYRPVEISLSWPTNRTPRQEALACVSQGSATTAVVVVEYLDEKKVRFGYVEPAHGPTVVYSPAVPAQDSAVHSLRLSIGGPYSEYDGRNGRLRAQFDHLTFWDVPAVSFGTYPGKLTVGPEAGTRSNRAGFTGVIHGQQTIVMPELARPRMSGVRVRITITPEMIDRSFPLLCTGRTKAGDILLLRAQRNGKLTFSYDHWGDALLSSPAVPFTVGETRVIEFSVPALTPAANPELLVKVDGATIWRQKAPAFAFDPKDIFLGANPIGGSTCEKVLENGIFEELEHPPPSP
jgi:hypothetical protein